MVKGLLLTALECSKRTGLTIRALRLYESHGLITPRRTEKGWRLYAFEEIKRLNEIVVLKALGMSLATIKTLLTEHEITLDHSLDVQEQMLLARQKQTDKALQSLHFLKAKLQTEQEHSLDDLLNLIKEANSLEDSIESNVWKAYAQARPRREVVLKTGDLQGLAGTWAFDDGIIMQTILRDHTLYYTYPNQLSYLLSPEAPDQFFMKGLSVQISFIRNAHGEVIALQHHQGGLTEIAQRVTEDKAVAQSTALAQQIKQQQAHQESKLILSQLIAALIADQLDVSGMTALLAQLVTEQQQHIHSILLSLGALQQLCFESVSQHGEDIYLAQFEHGKLAFCIAFTPSGQVGTFSLQPI